ncbi:hypothetical protein CDD82_2865 [Ophiocordyceps australis]|uniref:Uncharacterized protein n=1 Tax=Ophiocordyceps australis TaxID=1399860 RepID=A0A2C5ZG48_9HYPO|nr:hypothetical protein CDD82_2865 [Ophiocordyceps australis]
MGILSHIWRHQPLKTASESQTQAKYEEAKCELEQAKASIRNVERQVATLQQRAQELRTSGNRGIWPTIGGVVGATITFLLDKSKVDKEYQDLYGPIR